MTNDDFFKYKKPSINNLTTRADTTTMATVHIMFYYTPQFQRSTSNILAYVNQVIAQTNTGYANSKVHFHVLIKCHKCHIFQFYDLDSSQVKSNVY